MWKIMAEFEDGHPDTLVDVCNEDVVNLKLGVWKDWLSDNPNNREGYTYFYKEAI